MQVLSKTIAWFAMNKKLIYILLSLALAVIGFPNLVSQYDLTIDPQIHWVFNSLFQENFLATQNIIFPHGPLSFLEYPLGKGKNILFSSIFFLSVRFVFAFVALKFYNVDKNWSSFFILIALILFLQYLDFELVLCGLVFLLVATHLKTHKKIALFLAVLIAVVSFYIKISIGVVAGTLLGSYCIYLCYTFGETNEVHYDRNRASLSSILLLLSYPLVLFAFWIAFYKTGSGFFTYLIGVKELVLGNSDSASLYPDNNWWYLSISVVSLAAIPFFLEKKQNRFLFFISLLSILAVWKHSMAREDAWHIMKFFYWVFFIGATLLLNEPSRKLASRFLLCTSLIFFYQNARNVTGAALLSIKTLSVNAITQNIITNDGKKKSQSALRKEARRCDLEAEDIFRLKNSTVDCYPYNYCFIERNNLDWVPRPIIQSYAAYTPWLDKKNAEHFLSDAAPQYLIWENDILKRDRWNSAMTSIDGRYLLHDEPQTIDAIFRNYIIVNKAKEYTLWEKRDTTLKGGFSESLKDSLQWGKWFPVPQIGTFMNAQVELELKVLGKLKAALYKGEAVYIEYKTDLGIRKHRITQKHANKHLWVSPLLGNLNSNELPPAVRAIRFSTNNPNLYGQDIILEWKSQVSFDDFILYPYENIFKRPLIDLYSVPDSTIISKSQEDPQILKPQNYSSSINIPSKEIPLDSIQVVANLEFNMSCLAKAKLVIEIQNNGEQKSWESIALDKYITHCNAWENVYFAKDVVLSEGDMVKVYVWNNGLKEMSIKNFQCRNFNMGVKAIL